MTDYLIEHLDAGPHGAHILFSLCGMLFSLSINPRLPLDSHCHGDDPSRDMSSGQVHDGGVFPFRRTLAQHLACLIRRLLDADLDDDEYDRVSRALMSCILNAGEHLMLALAHNFRSRVRNSPFLGDHLSLPTPYLAITDQDESCPPHHDCSSNQIHLVDVPNCYFPDQIKHAHPGAHLLGFVIDPGLPEYHMADVRVLETLVHNPAVDHVACKVDVGGETLFLKAERGGIAFGNSVVGRDFRTMLAIRAAVKRRRRQQRADEDADDHHGHHHHHHHNTRLSSSSSSSSLVSSSSSPPPSPASPSFPLPTSSTLRIPQLRGFLRHPVEGHVIGFLRDWVPGASLDACDVAGVGKPQRARWDRDVAATLCHLHDLGLAWGAAARESVIVADDDGTGNDRRAWIVDFGARVHLGLRREAGDLQDGDWDDYDAVWEHLQLSDDDDDDDEGEEGEEGEDEEIDQGDYYRLGYAEWSGPSSDEDDETFARDHVQKFSDMRI